MGRSREAPLVVLGLVLLLALSVVACEGPLGPTSTAEPTATKAPQPTVVQPSATSIHAPTPAPSVTPPPVPTPLPPTPTAVPTPEPTAAPPFKVERFWVSPELLRGGETGQFVLRMSGMSPVGDAAGFTVSFPALTASGGDSDESCASASYESAQGVVSIAELTPGSGPEAEIKFCDAGDTLAGTDGDVQVTYLTIDVQIQQWQPGETRTLTLDVTPKQAGPFSIRYRAGFCSEDGLACDRVPDAGAVDQQGEFVSVFSIGSVAAAPTPTPTLTPTRIPTPTPVIPTPTPTYWLPLPTTLQELNDSVGKNYCFHITSELFGPDFLLDVDTIDENDVLLTQGIVAASIYWRMVPVDVGQEIADEENPYFALYNLANGSDWRLWHTNTEVSSYVGMYKFKHPPSAATAIEIWIFEPLGGGEFRISSYSDETRHLEAVFTAGNPEVGVNGGKDTDGTVWYLQPVFDHVGCGST